MQQSTIGRVAAGIGGIAAIVGFFLPWVSITVAVPSLPLVNTPPVTLPAINFSGLQVAAGPTIRVPAIGDVQVAQATVSIWLVVVAGAVSLASAVAPGDRKVTLGLAAGAIVTAVLAMLFVWLRSDDLRLPVGINLVVRLAYQAGLWVTLAGLAASILGGALALLAPGRPVSPAARQQLSTDPSGLDDEQRV